MTSRRQGQIWWANLLEPLGWRPVLILTRSDALPHLHWATVAPLTRTIRNIGSEVLLEPDDDLPERCAVTLDNIATIEQDRMVSQLTELTNEQMNAVWEALYYAFDLPF